MADDEKSKNAALPDAYANGRTLLQKQFQKNDTGFRCVSCGAAVLPLGSSSRNHCPKCLCSLHVDICPGDRQNQCHGILRPVSAVPDAKKGYIIIHRCEKCGAIVRNKAAVGNCTQPDDLALLIHLTANPAPNGTASPPIRGKKSVDIASASVDDKRK